MACAPCYETFLDSNPALRESIHGALDNMLALPVEALDFELEELSGYIDDLEAQVDAYNTDILGFDQILEDLGTQMDLAGINPGDCLQLDQAVMALQSVKSVIQSAKNPAAKALDGLQGRLAQVSSMSSAVNNLIANAEGLRC